MLRLRVVSLNDNVIVTVIRCQPLLVSAPLCVQAFNLKVEQVASAPVTVTQGISLDNLPGLTLLAGP